MALTPEGSPYVEASDLVADYPATSLALANRVDLVGVLPFATSAARATAIPSPTDGQYSYLQDTNSTEFWNGAAWTAAGTPPGLVLVEPTSISNTGGTATKTGGQVTFSAVSTLNLNGMFTSTYDNYKIMIDATTSANNSFNFRLRVAGVDASGSNYVHQYLNVNNTAVAAARATATSIPLFDTNTPIRSAAAIEIMSPSVAQATNFLSYNQYSVLSAGINLYAGTHSVSTAYDGLSFTTSTGTVTGIIRIYGYDNS